MAIVFRDRAIAAQSTSEALDQPVHVVPLRAWIALGLALLLLAGGAVWLLAGSVAITAAGSGTIVNPPTNVPVSASADGTLVGEGVRIGAHLAKGDPVAVISSGGALADQIVTTPVAGTVVAVGAGPGAAVTRGDLLATVAPDTSPQIAYLYVPVETGDDVRPGMTVHLLPQQIDSTVNGYLLGVVASISPLPVTRSRLAYVLSDQPLADTLAAAGPLLEVHVALLPDPSSPTGYAWTQPPGPDAPIISGTPTTGSVIVDQVPPYRAFFSG